MNRGNVHVCFDCLPTPLVDHVFSLSLTKKKRKKNGFVGSRQPRRRTSEGISGDSQAAMPRAARGRMSGFLFEVRGARPRTHQTTDVEHLQRHTQSR